MNDVEFWIWIQRTLGAGARLDEMLAYFGSARGLYEAGKNEWLTSGIFDDKKVKRLSSCSPSESAVIINRCVKNGWKMLTIESDDYPEMLKRIGNPPAVLYVDGELDFLKNNLAIGVIGTRHPSRYGMEVAQIIVSGLASAQVSIISGGAVGIDSIAHTTCMNCGQKTALVMGCGFGTRYLMQNESLRRRVSENGALITEYPPMVSPTGSSFVTRNRIISGISNGVVIIEAGEKSGSLNTAMHAKMQGRDVFVLPGDSRGTSFTGANALIHDGAKTVFGAGDILETYGMRSRLNAENQEKSKAEPFEGQNEFPLGVKREKRKTKTTINKKKEAEQPQKEIQIKPQPEITLDNLSQSAIIVYNLLKTDNEMRNTDYIVSMAGLPPSEVLCALTELEIENVVQVSAGGFYSLKNS